MGYIELYNQQTDPDSQDLNHNGLSDAVDAKFGTPLPPKVPFTDLGVSNNEYGLMHDLNGDGIDDINIHSVNNLLTPSQTIEVSNYLRENNEEFLTLKTLNTLFGSDEDNNGVFEFKGNDLDQDGTVDHLDNDVNGNGIEDSDEWSRWNGMGVESFLKEFAIKASDFFKKNPNMYSDIVGIYDKDNNDIWDYLEQDKTN
jgi:hypothetical protein